MAYTPIMPNMKLTAADMGAPDYADALRKGFQTSADVYKPSTAAAGLLDAMLKNKQQQILNQYLPRIAEARAGSMEANQALIPYRQKLLEAQTQRALQVPKSTYSNLEKAMQGYERVKQQYGESSPEASQFKNYIERLSQGNAGLQLTTDPNTGALTSLSFGGGGRNSPQSILTTDENGNQVVVSKPTTAQSTTQQKSSLSEIGRQTIANEAEMPYVGSGSNAKLLEDRINYDKGNKEAGERLVKAAVAKMIAPEYAGFQLASQGIPATIPALKHQYETIQQGWPISTNLVLDNLPPELQKEAKKQHAKLLAKIKGAKELHAAKGYPVKVGENTNKKRLKYNPATGRLE